MTNANERKILRLHSSTSSKEKEEEQKASWDSWNKQKMESVKRGKVLFAVEIRELQVHILGKR